MQLAPFKYNEIRAAIKPFRFGENFIYRIPVESTNSLAKELVMAGNPLPLIAVAEEQTRGKGRMKRSWFSPRYGGIWMSVVFPPVKENYVFGHYNYAVSLAIVTTVETCTNLEVSLKWPNDILVSGKKICGILSELVTRADGSQVVITGVGLNVNIGREEFPEELLNKATSLSIETGALIDRQNLFLEIIHSLNKTYSQWEHNGIEPIYNEWQMKCSTTGKHVAIRTGKQYISGTAEKVNVDGSLVIRDEKGTKYTIFAGDLEYILRDNMK